MSEQATYVCLFWALACTWIEKGSLNNEASGVCVVPVINSSTAPPASELSMRYVRKSGNE